MPANRIIDGVDLLPHLEDRIKPPPHETLFWRVAWPAVGVRAIRKGNWKLVKLDRRPTELYDLSNDIKESTNLAEQNPDIVEELSKALSKWDSELSKPLWQPTYVPHVYKEPVQ